MWKPIALIAVLIAVPLAPAAAQSSGVSAEDIVSQGKRSYGPPPPRRSCNNASSAEEIVVCAQQEQDDSEYRVKSTSELDGNSREALNDGTPRAPDVGGDGIFKGKPTLNLTCLLGGCDGEPIYMIDFEALPEAPAGSDADLIAQGKKRAD